MRNRSSWINTPSFFPHIGTVSQGSPVDGAPLAPRDDSLINSPRTSFLPFLVSLPQAPTSASWDLLRRNPNKGKTAKCPCACYDNAVPRTPHLCSRQPKAGAYPQGPSHWLRDLLQNSRPASPCHIIRTPAGYDRSDCSLGLTEVQQQPPPKKLGGRGGVARKKETPPDTPLLRNK